MKRIAIIGAGAFGFAMAKIISDKNIERKMYIFDVQKEYITHIKRTGGHPIFHKKISLAKNVRATNSLKSAVINADIILLAVPSNFMRSAIADIKPYLNKEVIFLNIAKGLECCTNKRMSQIITEELRGYRKKYHICSLSGGMIAQEVTQKNPLCAEVACSDIKIALEVSHLLENDHFRLEITQDIIGVELSGAFKNVIAIGAGILDGLGFGVSSKSAFVSYAAREAANLGVALGANKETFEAGSQAWFGDLMTSCFGKSRNRKFGELIGKEKSVKKTLSKLDKHGKTVEGYHTALVVYDLIKKNKINAPLLKMIYNVLYDKINVKDFAVKFIKEW